MKLFPLQMRPVLGVLFILAFFTGCGSGGGSSSTSATPPTPPAAVIPDTTKVLDGISQQALEEVSQDKTTYTFAGWTDFLRNLQPGQVMASGRCTALPQGMVRRVSSIREANGKVIVATEFAALSDAIESGAVQVSESLIPQSFSTTSQTTAAGYSLTTSPARFQGSPEVEYTIENLVIFDKDNNYGTTDDQVRLEGKLTCKIHFDLEFHYRNFKLDYLRYKYSVTTTSQITLRAGVSIDLTKETQLGPTIDFAPITVFVGFLPVNINPKVSLLAGVEGTFSAGMKVTKKWESTRTTTLIYQDEKWNKFKEDSDTGPQTDVSMSLAANGKVYVGARCDLLIMGIAGPYAKGKIYAELESDLFATPWWSLYLGAEVSVGIRVEIFGSLLLDAEFPQAVGIRFLWREATNPAPIYGHVEGLVRDASSGNLLANVPIRLVDSQGRGTTVNTDSSGRYRIQGQEGSGYRIEINFSGYQSFSKSNLTVNINDTTYVDAYLQPESGYTSAGDSGGNDSSGGSGTVPAPPTGVQATYIGNGQIKINWPYNSSIISYRIYWGTSSNVGTYSNQLSTSSTEYILSGVVPTYQYYYRVMARNDVGWSELSTVVSASVPVDPRVSVSQTNAWEGTTLQEPGAGFTPNGSVTLYFRNPQGTVFAEYKNADNSGRYSHSYTVHSGTMRGTWTYWAKDGTTGKTSPQVTFTIH